MACIAFLRSVLDVKECVPLMNFRHLQNIRHDLFSVEDGVTRARALVCAEVRFFCGNGGEGVTTVLSLTLRK